MLILQDLDITSLLKVAAMFDEVMDLKADSIVRDAAIQRFEFTYELVWKILRKILLKRGLEANSPRNVFRLAAKDDIIFDVEMWFSFVDYRNQTSHVYNENIAQEIYAHLPEFRQLNNDLIAKLKTEEYK